MAIPLIIGGIAAAAGLFGAKKGLDAKNNYSKAKSIVEDAMETFDDAKERLEEARNEVSEGLEELGKIRLTVEGDAMKRFVEVIGLIHNVQYKPITLGGLEVNVSPPELQVMQGSAYRAADLLKDGITAVSSGVLTGIGAGGLATSIGAASTGTAISSLSGVAATNATLAWLGGGSLASGGLGMAGGTMVLGGAIAGPVIAVIGFAAAKKSERALTEATIQEAEVLEAAEQIENGITVLEAIHQRIEEVSLAISGVTERFQKILTLNEQMLGKKQMLLTELQQNADTAKAAHAQLGLFKRFWMRLRGIKQNFTFDSPFDYNNFTEQEKQTYSTLTAFGYELYALLKVQVLDDQGLASQESEVVVAEAQKFLECA